MQMNVTLERVNDAVHFVADNSMGHTIDIDGAERVGGVDAGFRPMQMVLAAVGGCSVMDLVAILSKQRAGLQDIKIRVTGERETGGVANPFSAIHIHYDLYGEVDREKAERAVQLAVEKYCSVAEMLKATVKITYDFSIISV